MHKQRFSIPENDKIVNKTLIQISYSQTPLIYLPKREIVLKKRLQHSLLFKTCVS